MIDEIPLPIKLDWCQGKDCLALPRHRAGLCEMAKFVRAHTRGVAHAVWADNEKRRLKSLRHTRWDEILMLQKESL